MTEEQEERFVLAFEQIAEALEGIHEIKQKQFDKQWPERQKTREAVYSRLPTEEDLIREKQGTSGESLKEWLTFSEDELIGERERAFLEAAGRVPAESKDAACAEAAGQGEPEAGSPAAPEDYAGTA